MAKLWSSENDFDKRVESFTVGQDRELDVQLAASDILGTLAHIRMLASIQLLEKKELEVLIPALKDIYQRILAKDFQIEAGVEDIHSQVELELTQKLGEVGKKIHSGRSRNDQVLVDLKLFFRTKVQNLVQEVESFFQTLIELSEQYKKVLMPGYTHMQVAMPSSFGLWFGAYAEALVDDLRILHAAYEVINQNPLGSAAGYGSSFPLDRQMTSDLLGFRQANINVIYAQMGRGKVERVLSSALANLASTLSRLAMDVCLYNGQNFAFFKFPEGLTTGSSIMPHKKNPDIFELTRARMNKVQALPQELLLISNNLPSGYHRDFQLLKESLFPAFQNLSECLEMLNYALKKVEIRADILKEEKYAYIFSVEEVNKKVLQGLPFREAYKEVAAQIRSGEYQASPELNHQHLGSIGHLGNDHIQQAMQAQIKEFDFDKVAQALNDLWEI